MHGPAGGPHSPPSTPPAASTGWRDVDFPAPLRWKQSHNCCRLLGEHAIMSNLLPTVEGPHAWDQLPGEPRAWFVKFVAYLSLGPGRTYQAAYVAWKKLCKKHVDKPNRRGYPPEWNRMAKAVGFI